MAEIDPLKYERVPAKDVCRSLVGPHKKQAKRLRQLIEEIGDILDSEGGAPVALIIGGYCNGVHLVKGDEADSYVVFFYKDEVILLEEGRKASG